MKRYKSQRKLKAQTMTEYILLICLLAVGSIVVVGKLGNVIRAQLAASASKIAGVAPQERADQVMGDVNRHIRRGMDDFWKENQSSNSR